MHYRKPQYYDHFQCLAGSCPDTCCAGWQIVIDEESMERQLKLAGAEERKNLDFHKAILKGELPYTIGGGIGQSRLCMYFLRKAHIGDVKVSVWPEDMIKQCEENDIFLL